MNSPEKVGTEAALPSYLKGNMFVIKRYVEPAVAADSQPIRGISHPKLLLLDTRKPIQNVNKIRFA